MNKGYIYVFENKGFDWKVKFLLWEHRKYEWSYRVCEDENYLDVLCINWSVVVEEDQ